MSVPHVINVKAKIEYTFVIRQKNRYIRSNCDLRWFFDVRRGPMLRGNWWSCCCCCWCPHHSAALVAATLCHRKIVWHGTATRRGLRWGTNVSFWENVNINRYRGRDCGMVHGDENPPKCHSAGQNSKQQSSEQELPNYCITRPRSLRPKRLKKITFAHHTIDSKLIATH